MKPKVSKVILAVYDLLLSLGAAYSGIMMVSGNGIFAEFPKEWLSKVPFENWIIPGIIIIIVFGLGNAIAAICSLRVKCNKSWYMSAIMGGLFLINLVVQVLVLGEVYLATVEFIILSITQLCLCGYVSFNNRRNSVSGCI